MSGRRLAPEPAIPVGGGGDQVAPPQQFVPNPEVLASTDPTEAPPPVGASPEPPFFDEKGRRVDDTPEPEPEAEELSPEEEIMFASLLTCGRRSKTIKILDHVVVVETLNCDDDLRIGLFVKEYEGSLGDQRAYQVGVAAAGIRSFDGRPLVTTVYEGVDENALFDEKVAKIRKMYPTVVQRIYRAVMDAEKEFVALVERLGKSDG